MDISADTAADIMPSMMREYLHTHPWINFELDLSRAPAHFWTLLGEASAMCGQIASVPLPPGIARDLHEVYLAKGVRATTAIEGNTLSEQEVGKIVQGSLELPPSKEYLQREVENVLKACNEIMGDLKEGRRPDLTSQRITYFNWMVLKGLDVEPEVLPGEFRTYSVIVGSYRGAPAEDCEYLMEAFCDWFECLESPDERLPELSTSILRAILAHLYIAWIHPFGDGNGRTARLIELQTLLAYGVPSCAAQLLSNHYNETRPEYYRQLDRSSANGGDPLPFIEYALAGFVDGLREQLEYIRRFQLGLAWESYIHGEFLNKNRPSDVRRRDLIVELSAHNEPVSRADLPLVSPKVASAYASKTEKTVTRDINALTEMGLLVRKEGGYQANKEIMLGYLPIAGMPG